jgi:TonB family protein
MFEILPASSAGSEASPTHALLSVLVHGGLIATAVLVTAQVTTGPGVGAPIDQMIYIPALPSQPAPVGAVPPASNGGLPDAPVDASLPLPVGVPVGLPLPAGIAATGGSPNAGSAIGIGPPTWLEGPATSGAWAAAEVDEPVRVLTAGHLVYPPVLERAGITGIVMLEFVVDTLGVVEASTMHVVSATQEGFRAAAVEAVLATTFSPARVRGTAVRQLVRQQLRFVETLR